MSKKTKSPISESVASKIHDDICKQMDKEIEEGCITRFDQIKEMEAISTGNLSVDMALGVGGIPKGRIIEVYGAESSGKTSMCLGIVAQAQKTEKNKVVAYIDMEHALDPTHAAQIGVDIKSLVFSQPNSAEQAMDIVYALAKRGDVSLIVIDSVAALVPQDVIDKESGKVTVGLIARLLTSCLMKLNPVSSKTGTSIIFINQVRDKINTFGYAAEKEGTPGGRALKFYSSIRMELKNIGKITKSGDSDVSENVKDVIGQKVKVHIKKNKVSAPFKIAEVDLIFGRGFCYISDIINIAIKNKIITKSGSWFYLGETKIGQGKLTAIKTLRDDKDLFSKVEEKVKALIKEAGQLAIEDELADEEDILESEILAEVKEETKTESDWSM